MSLIMVSFPIFGRIFNGMGYIANRWSYALALVAAYTFVVQYEDFKKYKKKFIGKDSLSIRISASLKGSKISSILQE